MTKRIGKSTSHKPSQNRPSTPLRIRRQEHPRLLETTRTHQPDAPDSDNAQVVCRDWSHRAMQYPFGRLLFTDHKIGGSACRSASDYPANAIHPDASGGKNLDSHGRCAAHTERCVSKPLPAASGSPQLVQISHKSSVPNPLVCQLREARH